jgi:hypothetical protein
VTGLFGLISIGIAAGASGPRIKSAGLVYFGIGPALGVVGYIMGSRTQRAAEPAATTG